MTFECCEDRLLASCIFVHEDEGEGEGSDWSLRSREPLRCDAHIYARATCDLARHDEQSRTQKARLVSCACAAAMGTGVTRGTDCEHAARRGKRALRMHC